MGDNEIVAIAEKLKSIGNDYVKKGDYLTASAKYQKAIRYLNENPGFDDEDTEEYRKAYSSVKIASYLNLAMCHLKLGNAREALNATTNVIDYDPQYWKEGDLTKALFRRGMAYLALKDEEMAVKSFEEAAAKDPTDAAIKRELAVAKQKLAQRKQKEKAAYAKLFS